MKFKVNIIYHFQSGAWGGGNQFLKALRKELIKKGLYENNPKKANCIIFNSHHNINRILKLKYEFQNKIFIHRIDGPVSLIRGRSLEIDYLIYFLNKYIADGTVFQSQWSRRKNYSLGLKRNNFETIIMNAVDSSIFKPLKRSSSRSKTKGKCKLIAISWSNNFNKGFDLYHFLDDNLDFNQYSMKFVGNSPISFKNIIHIKPVNSNKLATLLQESDIYITGSKNDPCSNSLIEALSSGLPCIALNNGGHPEVIKNGGELFNTFDECLHLIQKVRDNYDYYKNNIQFPNIEEITELYTNYIKKIYILSTKKVYQIKRLKKLIYYYILLIQKLNQISFYKILISKFR